MERLWLQIETGGVVTQRHRSRRLYKVNESICSPVELVIVCVDVCLVHHSVVVANDLDATCRFVDANLTFAVRSQHHQPGNYQSSPDLVRSNALQQVSIDRHHCKSCSLAAQNSSTGCVPLLAPPGAVTAAPLGAACAEAAAAAWVLTLAPRLGAAAFFGAALGAAAAGLEAALAPRPLRAGAGSAAAASAAAAAVVRFLAARGFDAAALRLGAMLAGGCLGQDTSDDLGQARLMPTSQLISDQAL